MLYQNVYLVNLGESAVQFGAVLNYHRNRNIQFFYF